MDRLKLLGLIEKIKESPADDTARLVFADFVEENNQTPAGEAYAEFIRLQCGMNNTKLAPNQIPSHLAELEGIHRADWLGWLGIPTEMQKYIACFERGIPTMALAQTCLRALEEWETAEGAMEREQTAEEAQQETALIAMLRDLPIIIQDRFHEQPAHHLIIAHGTTINDLTLAGIAIGGQTSLSGNTRVGTITSNAGTILEGHTHADTLTNNGGQTELHNRASADHIITHGGKTALSGNARVRQLEVHGGTEGIRIQGNSRIGTFCVMHPETAEAREVDISSNNGHAICEQIIRLAREGFLPSLTRFEWRGVELSQAQLDAARASTPVIHSPGSNPAAVGAAPTHDPDVPKVG